MSDTQQQMAKLWARALGIKTVAPEDNFFALGGHSLLGVKLVAAVQEKLAPEIELNLSDLLEHPTLADFCAHLDSLNAPGAETGSI
ncbi:MAG TPA: phosphopantetheine-binding protein [Rhizomicrobium sp.]